jgi:hypothetical protein
MVVAPGLLALTAAAAAPPRAAAQTTAPTTLPATQADFDDSEQSVPPLAADSPIPRWLADLASPDAAARDAATTALMDLDRTQLAQLHQCVRGLAFPSPAQAAALHDIVIHDYLAADAYPPGPGGFLGLLSPFPMLGEPARLGYTVELRVPGFPAFRVLRTGDVILSVLVNPDAPVDRQRSIPTPDFLALQNAVSGAGAGNEVLLEVLRGGQRIRLSLRLAVRPLIPGNDAREATQQFFNERAQRGQAYWERAFLPLLRPGIS